MRFELHDHQARALDALRASLLAGKRRPMVQAPTGAGKTVLAAAIVDGALKKGKRVLFTVPFLNLIDQTVDAFSRQGIKRSGSCKAITRRPTALSRCRWRQSRRCNAASSRTPTW